MMNTSIDRIRESAMKSHQKRGNTMKLFRILFLLSIGCVLISATTALAADSAPAFNWTGPYVGVHLGYGWGNADTRFTPLPTTAGFYNLAPTTLSPGPSGVTGGLQAGYNYQVGGFVFGIDADFSGTGMSGTKTVSPIIQSDGTPFPGSGFLRAHQDVNWYGTVRPRVGYAVIPTLLVYATGGLAYGDVSYSANTDFRPVGTTAYPASFSKTKAGWTVGGGIEYAVCTHWTVRAEYLYMDLGSESVHVSPSTVPLPYQVGYKWETTANVFNLGVNYKF
jgi:outer membrane immunogenic protein